MSKIPKELRNPVHKKELPAMSMYFSIDVSMSAKKRREILKIQINEALYFLRQRLTNQEIQDYLAPVWHIEKKISKLTETISHICIFRTKKQFYFYLSPIDLGTRVIVANSFHIKPFLKSKDYINEHAVVWFHENGVSLAAKNKNKLTIIDTVILHFNHIEKPIGITKDKTMNQVVESAKQLIEKHITDKSAALIFAGDKDLIRLAKFKKIYSNICHTEIYGYYSKQSINQLESRLSQVLFDLEKSKIKSEIDLLINEMRSRGFYESKNIEEICSYAAQGRVRALLVPQDYHLFGELNRLTGEIKINGHQKNPEDDDLFDDIAELTLYNHGKVMAVPKKLIPNESLIVAYIQKSEMDLTHGQTFPATEPKLVA